MILPQQKILPLYFEEETRSIRSERIKDLGPLHMRICNGINFTSEHQLPIVKPVCTDIPEKMIAYYRTKQIKQTNDIVAHFYTADCQFENVWNRPFAYIDAFKRFLAITSTDFSLLTNMLEMHRLWNDFRNKLLAAFYQKWNVKVIASPSWSADMQNIDRYMEGWPRNSLISINSTGVCHDKRSRHIWLDGYNAMLSILNPTHILRYGGFVEGERTEISTYYTNDNRIR